jgi:hypothetical protein
VTILAVLPLFPEEKLASRLTEGCIAEAKIMNMNEIKQIARDRGLQPGRLKKIDLIRAIQKDEGNESCFRTDRADGCDQDQCLWRADCLR